MKDIFQTGDVDVWPVSLRRVGVALLVFIIAAAMVYGFYAQAPRWDKNFGLSDNRHFFGPNAYFLDTCLKNGKYPLWNPLAYCGLPFAADPQASACYPFHLLRGLLTPAYNPYATATGMQIMMILHILWAGLGAFCLASSYGLSLSAGILGGLAFMFSPYCMIYYTDYYVYSLVISWAPWILWQARRAVYAQAGAKRVWHTGWTVIFFSLSTLGGFPQLSLYIGLALTLFILLDALMHVPWKFRVEALGRAARILAGRMVFLIVVAILVAMASAALLFPAFELGLHSCRSDVGGLRMPEWTQSFDGLHLLKCLVVFPGNLWDPKGCRAVGIGSLLLVLAALSHRRRRDVWVFVGMYLILTDCTLGPPFPMGALLHRFDFMNITDSPWRAGDFSILALGMVAAFGVDAAGRFPVSPRSRVARTAAFVCASAGMFLVLSLWLRNKPLFEPTFLVWLFPALTAAVVCALTWQQAPRVGSMLLAVLVGAEIVAWSAQMLPASVNRHTIGNNADTAQFGKDRHITRANRRPAHQRPNRQMWFLDHAINGYNPLILISTSQVLCRPEDDKAYFNRIHLKYKEITPENIRVNLLAKRCFWLARQWVAGDLPGKRETFPAATTVFLPEIPSDATLCVPEVARTQLPKTAVSDTTERITLISGVELKKAIKQAGSGQKLVLPKLMQGFVHAVLYVGYTATERVDIDASCVDEQGVHHTLMQCQTANTGKAEKLLEIPLPDCNVSTITLTWMDKNAKGLTLTQAYVLKDLMDEDRHIVIEDRSANTVEVTLKDLPGARLLAFLDSYYPGWHAWVDGQEVEILKADDAFKAVAVPAGTHRVRFEYRPMVTYAGIGISGATFTGLALMLLGTVWWGSASRKQPPHRTDTVTSGNPG